jgi:hypothetical protein
MHEGARAGHCPAYACAALEAPAPCLPLQNVAGAAAGDSWETEFMISLRISTLCVASRHKYVGAPALRGALRSYMHGHPRPALKASFKTAIYGFKVGGLTRAI